MRFFLKIINLKSSTFLTILGILCLYSITLLYALEPTGSAYKNPLESIWWFIVTVTTVGYGDLYPTTLLTKYLVGLPVILIGIGMFTVLITKIIELFWNIFRRKRMGKVQLNEENHIVIVGYHPERTEQIINELLADAEEKRNIVVCFTADQAKEGLSFENKKVKVVSGSDLSSSGLIKRACINKASNIIIDTGDDNQGLVACLAMKNANPKAYMVVALNNLDESRKKINLVSRKIVSVSASMITMIVQEIQDHGITTIYKGLLSNTHQQTGYKLFIPENFGKSSYGELLVFFKKRYEATLIGASDSHDDTAKITKNPYWDFVIKGGMSLYYISKNRITYIPWDKIETNKD